MSDTPDAVSQRLEAARRLAWDAGRSTLQFFQRDNFQVERKADDSPVTVADREAELHIRRAVAEQFPDDAIIGEEFGVEEGASGFRWILDPIDGTKSFISGVPLYGTMIGIEQDGRPLIGVVYIPGLDEGVYAAAGQGAWHVKGPAEPRPARVSERRTLAVGLFLTSQVDSFANRDAAEAFLQLQEAACLTRTWGDCYGYLLVATGRAEVMVDPLMKVWDAAAILPIIQEAGGLFTDWQGKATIHGGEGIGCNRHVFREVLAITSRFSRPP